MITEEKYLEAKKITNEYEEQLNIGDVSGSLTVTDLTHDEIMMDVDVCKKCFFNADCQKKVFEYCNSKLKQTQYYR